MAPKSDKTLSEVARSLLVAERSANEPAALKERALSRALRTLEEGRRPRPGAGVVERSFASRARGPGLFAAAAFAVAGLAAAGSGFFKASEPAPPVVAVAKPLPMPRVRASAAPIVPTAEPPAEAPRPSAVAPTRARVTAPPPPPSASADASVPTRARQYAIELALLEPARSGVARGDFSGALAAVQRHRLEFPAGQLAEERSALQVRALFGLGRVGEAEAAAAAFRQRYPRSALLSWMPLRRAPSP